MKVSVAKRPATILCCLVVGLVALAGCHPVVHLMPTPAVMRTGEHNPFSANPDLEKSNRVPVLYATNRLPVGENDARTYTIFVSDELHMGVADFRIGSEETTWEMILRLSTSEAPDERPRLHLENLNERARFDPAANAFELTPGARNFFAHINEAIAKSMDKDLMLYVHGANSSVYRAGAQAAQYRHFTGRNSVVMAFFWPSAESLLKYGTDVRNAARTTPVFTRFIELLARHSEAEMINILAYSAGAQIVSPGLAALGRDVPPEKRGELRRRLRLGEVYFAAPDVDFKQFVNHLPEYNDLTRNVTLSLNMRDSVLGFAEYHHGVSRAGRPKREDLSEEEIQWVLEAARQPTFDVLVVDKEFVPMDSPDAHSFWYEHPWVSSDVLIQFLFHAEPPIRGLEERTSEGNLQYWTFPADYPDRIIRILREAADRQQPQS